MIQTFSGYSKILHLPDKRSVSLMELPNGNMLLQGTVNDEATMTVFSRDATFAVMELIQDWWAQEVNRKASATPTNRQRDAMPELREVGGVDDGMGHITSDADPGL